MLKIVANPEFSQTVKIQMPVDGGTKEVSFKGRFRAMRQSELTEMQMNSATVTTEFLQKVFVGWEGLADEDGAPLECNDANRDLLIDLPFVRQALAMTYFDAVSGVKAAKRGN